MYVGNLPADVDIDESTFCQFLAQACKIIGIETDDPIISCWMAPDKTYSFVEFRGVQDAENARKTLARNGVKLKQRILTFGRPRDFKPSPPHLEGYVVGGPDPPLPEDMDVSAYIEEIFTQIPNIFRKTIGGDVGDEI